MSLSSTIESSVITNIAFWVVSISVIVSSFAVVQIRDLFRAALFLVLAFVGIAGMFILLRAEFLAVVQILIYVGAISVLIIFAILMTRDVSDGNPHNRLKIPASILGLVFFVVFTFVMVQVDWNVQPVPEPIPDTPQSDSVEIFTKFSSIRNHLLSLSFPRTEQIRIFILLLTSFLSFLYPKKNTWKNLIYLIEVNQHN